MEVVVVESIRKAKIRDETGERIITDIMKNAIWYQIYCVRPRLSSLISSANISVVVRLCLFSVMIIQISNIMDKIQVFL